jgi:hypothetical protein
MPTPHARDEGLRRIRTITGWAAAAAVSAVALISVGVARASTNATSTGIPTGSGVTDPGFTGVEPDDPWGTTGSAGLQPPANPPAQGIGGGQAVSGGS